MDLVIMDHHSNTTYGIVNSTGSSGEVVECFSKSEEYDSLRFALVVYFGTPVAICGMISNAILIKIFSKRKRIESPTLYFFLLAIFDCLICIIYLPFFTVDALAIYFGNAALYRLWHHYVMLLYGTSRVVQFASTYMVVCATLERFVVVANLKPLSFISTSSGRYLTVTTTLILVLVLRLFAFFDYKIEHNSSCPVFQDYTFVPLLMSRDDYKMYNFYILSVVHILLPFLLLLILNLLIIALTKRKISQKIIPPSGYSFNEMPLTTLLLRKESILNRYHHRNELRYATRTMVMITFTYLIFNIFNVIITVMENVFQDNHLMMNEDGSSTKFYTYTADLISILVTINSFARIFVYFFCNPQFRYQLVCYAKQCLLSVNSTDGSLCWRRKYNTTSKLIKKEKDKQPQQTQYLVHHQQKQQQQQQQRSAVYERRQLSLPVAEKSFEKGNSRITASTKNNSKESLRPLDAIAYYSTDHIMRETVLNLINNKTNNNKHYSSKDKEFENDCDSLTVHSSKSTLYV